MSNDPPPHLRALLESAEKATPRPWEVRREDHDPGFIDYHVHNGTGGHLAACGEMASDNARSDADYIARAANMAPALARFVEEVCEDMSHDECPLCMMVRVRGGWVHVSNCPILQLTRDLEQLP